MSVPLDTGSPSAHWAAYPYPWLVPESSIQVDFEAAILENSRFRLWFVPDLGKIVRIQNVASNLDLIPFTGTIEQMQSSRRGVKSEAGLDLYPRPLTDLGPVEVAFVEGEDDSIGLLTHEITGEGLSFHAWVTLNESISVVVRVFNRTPREIPFDFSGEKWPVRWDRTHLAPPESIPAYEVCQFRYEFDIDKSSPNIVSIHEMLDGFERFSAIAELGSIQPPALGEGTAAYLIAAMGAMRIRDFASADELLNAVLDRSGEHFLAWYLKAVVQRLQNTEGSVAETEPSSELLNAHFLAPMEPLLKVEAFLASHVHTAEPSPLVDSIARDPIAAIDCAYWFHATGQFDMLSRWVDEVLRHKEAPPMPLLHYYLADALLLGSRMEMEAAGHVARAARQPVTHPYPVRSHELRILERLSQRFPKDSRLTEWMFLARKGLRA